MIALCKTPGKNRFSSKTSIPARFQAVLKIIFKYVKRPAGRPPPVFYLAPITMLYFTSVTWLCAIWPIQLLVFMTLVPAGTEIAMKV